MRRSLLVVLPLVLVLIAGPSTLPASAKKHKLSVTRGQNQAHYGYDCAQCGPGATRQIIPRCSYNLYFQFPAHKDATDYYLRIHDRDPRVNATYDLHGPPFQDHLGGGDAPSGSHRFTGFTGGDGPEPCTPLSAFIPRFQILKAEYTTGGKAKIAGTVYTGKGEAASGVPVKIGSMLTTTDPQGFFALEVKDGTYSVSAGKDYCVLPRGGTCDHDKRVKVDDSAEQVDFQAPAFEISGHVRKTCEGGACSTGKGVEGVAVTATPKTGDALATITDAKGHYSVDVPKGTYDVVPILPGYEFDPTKKAVASGTRDRKDVDFDGCGPPTRDDVATAAQAPGSYDQTLPASKCGDNLFWANVVGGKTYLFWEAPTVCADEFKTRYEKVTFRGIELPFDKDTPVEADATGGSKAALVRVDTAKPTVIKVISASYNGQRSGQGGVLCKAAYSGQPPIELAPKAKKPRAAAFLPFAARP